MTNGEISGNRGFWSRDSYGYGDDIVVHESGFFEMPRGVIVSSVRDWLWDMLK